MHDFVIQYPSKNQNALFEKWDEISRKIHGWKNNKIDASYDNIDESINFILILLKQLHPRRQSFNKTVKCFITFNNVNAFKYFFVSDMANLFPFKLNWHLF